MSSRALNRAQFHRDTPCWPGEHTSATMLGRSLYDPYPQPVCTTCGTNFEEESEQVDVDHWQGLKAEAKRKGVW